MSIWILTSEYNDYDQHGEYFECVFKTKPTLDQIKLECEVNDARASRILAGGQREDYEYKWYSLVEYKFK